MPDYFDELRVKPREQKPIHQTPPRHRKPKHERRYYAYTQHIQQPPQRCIFSKRKTHQSDQWSPEAYRLVHKLLNLHPRVPYKIIAERLQAFEGRRATVPIVSGIATRLRAREREALAQGSQITKS